MAEAAQTPRIAVVGSLNIDYYTRVERFPRPGETVAGEELRIRFGGKGANQAVAARRRAAEVEMIGCLGADEMGDRYRARLSDEGLGVAGLLRVESVATGSAFINLDAGGENTIVVAAGANGELDAEHVRANSSLIEAADAVLLQNEVPHAANREAAHLAQAAGVTVIYNPAPWDGARDVGELQPDLLIVNELEAQQLMPDEGSGAGLTPASIVPRLVVTRGADPAVAYCAGRCFEVPAEPVQVVDSVGAGDAFVGALAVAFVRGREMEEAIRSAHRVAAIVCGELGAQEAMPDLARLDE